MIFFYLLTSLNIVLSSQIEVTLDDKIYIFLDGMAIKGIIKEYKNDELPLSKAYIIESLEKINYKRSQLSMIEQKILDRYLLKYNFIINNNENHTSLNNEVPDYRKSLTYYMKNYFSRLYQYNNNESEFFFLRHKNNNDIVWMNFGVNSRYETIERKNRIVYNYHYALGLILGNQVCIYSDANLYSMIYNNNFNNNPSEFKGGFPIDRPGFYGYEFERSFEYANSYIKYSSKFGEISFSKNSLVWGNGKYPVILSNNTPSFPLFKWTHSIARTSFSFFHGSIMPKSINIVNNGLMTSEKKYLVGHRSSVQVTDNFSLAFTEMLVYGGRSPELTYFFPTVFLWPIQHNMTSQSEDNILWFFESKYYFLDNYRIYGTFLIDELNTKQMFNDWFGNRWLCQIGLDFSKIIFSLPVTFKGEFTAARPWVYTHRVPAFGTYTHNGRSLGFKYGPNSQVLYLESHLFIDHRNSINISFEKLKYGIAPADDIDSGFDFGNDPNQNYLNANTNKYEHSTTWLIGDIQESYKIEFKYTYELSNSTQIQANLVSTKTESNIENSASFQFRINF